MGARRTIKMISPRMVLLIAGVTFVRGNGSRASRLQVFWRAIVTWIPLALAAILFGLIYHKGGLLAAGIATGLFFGGLVASGWQNLKAAEIDSRFRKFFR